MFGNYDLKRNAHINCSYRFRVRNIMRHAVSRPNKPFAVHSCHCGGLLWLLLNILVVVYRVILVLLCLFCTQFPTFSFALLLACSFELLLVFLFYKTVNFVSANILYTYMRTCIAEI